MALLFFVPFLGGVHLFDSNEINGAECAREMLLSGDFLQPQINFQPFWDTPPLFYWFQALSMRIFGVGEFAARFPNAICGLVTLLLAYRLGTRLHDRSFGWLWAFTWLGSLLPHLYFRSGLIDPWFNLLVFMGLYGFIEFRWQFFSPRQCNGFWRRYRYLLAGGGLLGVAMLIKGPVAFLLVLLTLILYWARYRFRNRGFLKHLVLFSAVALSVFLFWIGAETLRQGTGFISAYTSHQTALWTTRTGFPGASLLLLFLGCFPASVFALPNLWGDGQTEDELLESDTLVSCQRSDLGTWLQIFFWVIVVSTTLLPVQALQVVSLAFFPLTYLGAVTLWRAMRWHLRPRVVGILLPALGILIGLAEAALPLLGKPAAWLSTLFGDLSWVPEKFQSGRYWDWWLSLPGVLLVVASLAGWYLWRKDRGWQSAQTVLTGGVLFASFTLLGWVRGFEQYFQCAAIEFYESKAGENCRIQPLGFHSNAHLFYTRQTACAGGAAPALSGGAPGQKVYFVAKCAHLQDSAQLTDCRELYRKDGFVFFERVGK